MGNRKISPNPRHARSWSPSVVVADLERIRRQMLAVARSSPYPAGRQQAILNAEVIENAIRLIDPTKEIQT